MLVRWHARLRRWRRRFSRAEWIVRLLRLPVSSAPDHSPGLLLIQIDGLARAQLEQALKKRRLPWLRRLLRRDGYRLHDFYSGLPASTPAVQGELHYGVPAAVPAFTFLDRRTGRIDMMMQPGPAKRIEADLAAQADGLLRGGSSWSNIYTGGADQAESHFCGASIGLGDLWHRGKPHRLLLIALLHPVALLRLLGLLVAEFALAAYDAVRGIFSRHQSWRRETLFVFARTLVCVGLRELITLGARTDLARGVPIIHVNFLGYDEQSHRRGPSSAFAHWTLKGIDHAIRRLQRAARRSGRRDYDVWIFSDHGQIRATPFSHHVELGLEGLVRRHLAKTDSAAPAPHPTSPRRQEGSSPASWLGGPRRHRRTQRAESLAALSAFERDVIAVAALGPVGHLYFAQPPEPDQLRRIAAGLVSDGVPGILIPRPDGKVDWLTPQGEFVLPDHSDQLPHSAALRPVVAADLARLAQHTHAGHLVALGWGLDGTSFTFTEENGSHAGCSPEETGAFLLLPRDVQPPSGDRPTRPADLRQMALDHLEPTAPPVGHRNRSVGGTESKSRPTLRVATYNTHGCLGLDGRCSPYRIARVLRELDADVIALQELDCGCTRSRAEDQLAEIASHLDYHACFCPTTERDAGSYGHGLLCRFPFIDTHCGRLPGPPGREPRAALRADFTWAGQTVRVVATHLGLGRTERSRQIDALLSSEWLGGLEPEQPLIFCGDLNLVPGSPSYRRLAAVLREVQAHCPDHVGRPTFPSLLPVRALDHIFISPPFTVRAVTVPVRELTRTASDHLPLSADLQLVEREASSTIVQSAMSDVCDHRETHVSDDIRGH